MTSDDPIYNNGRVNTQQSMRPGYFNNQQQHVRDSKTPFSEDATRARPWSIPSTTKSAVVGRKRTNNMLVPQQLPPMTQQEKHRYPA